MRSGHAQVSLVSLSLIAKRIADAVDHIHGGEGLRARMLLWEALGILANEAKAAEREAAE